MAQVINTNIPSLNAQRNLERSGTSLATALQRLSSGLRINSAKDDAAGLAISERFTTQIRGLNVAVRNANDGISLSQTAEGALGEIGNNLQRIRELAVQARNATNSASDRAALDAEVQQRLAEIDRTAAQTSFNGQKILDGSFGNATFQVGANAGETIGLTLDSSMRLTSLGAIAMATSATLGAAATGGTVDIASNTLLFGTPASPATNGTVTVAAATRLFANPGNPGSGGSIGVTPTLTDFTTIPAADGFNTQTPTDFDYSGVGNLAQFDVDGIGVTLSANYTDANGLAAAIGAQLGAAYNVTNNAGVIRIEGVGSVAPVVISNTDVNAGNAGFVNSGGSAGTAGGSATFSIDGTPVTLNAAYADANAVAAAISAQLGAGYTVSAPGNAYPLSIVNNTLGSAAVTITGADAGANFAGITNAVGTAGTPMSASGQANFNVDGYAILLNQDYASFDDLATAIQTQLNDPLNAGTGAYTVTNNNGAITITNNTLGAGSGAVTITGADAVAASTGFGNVVGTAGQNAVTSTNASFTVDGTVVTLNQDYADQNALAAAIDAQLPGYTVTAGGGGITITNDTAGSPAVAITAADANAIAAGIVNEVGTAGAGAGAVVIAPGGFTVTSPPSAAVDFAGTYASAQEFARAINDNASGVYASVNPNGSLSLRSSRDFSIGGTQANTLLGFTGTMFTATTGNLSAVNVLTPEGADEVIIRVDSALTAVSGLRSNFGAIQNRFESTIANLQTTSENLSASRSRILDADFAQETAELTRAQILQQAGTAILAQANQLPQNVLSLLQ